MKSMCYLEATIGNRHKLQSVEARLVEVVLRGLHSRHDEEHITQRLNDDTWVTVKLFRSTILLAQVKIILLCLFKVMSLHIDALIHSFKPVFKALVEIFFSETFHSFLDSSMKFIHVLEIFPRSCSLIFGKWSEAAGTQV